MVPLESGTFAPFGDQIFLSGLMRWSTEHAVCTPHREHDTCDVGEFHGATVHQVITRKNAK
jgi:hypothetical protein